MINDIGAELELAVRKATTPAHRVHLVERLRGWWHQKVHAHLVRVAAGEVDRILSDDVEQKLLDIAQAFAMRTYQSITTTCHDQPLMRSLTTSASSCTSSA